MSERRKFPISLFEEDDWFPSSAISSWFPKANISAFSKEGSGLTVSSDDKKFYVAAALPGLTEDQVGVSIDKEELWIKGEKEETEEDKKKKYYRKASSSFSYHVTLPEEVNGAAEPEAHLDNGELKITFVKAEQASPKKINVKSKK